MRLIGRVPLVVVGCGGSRRNRSFEFRAGARTGERLRPKTWRMCWLFPRPKALSTTRCRTRWLISGAWVTTRNFGKPLLRTDTELITKKDTKDRNRKDLNYFDVLVFASTTGELDLTDDQKSDMLSFVKEDGKGFVGIHAALDTNYKWPEYGEMIGGWFDEHPWFTFNAPIIVEDPNFPAVRHFPHAFVKRDEIYQPKSWSRDKVNVLLSLDASKLDYNNPRVHRQDHDFAVAWSKIVRQGASLLLEPWDTPRKRGMIPIFRRCISKRSSGCSE